MAQTKRSKPGIAKSAADGRYDTGKVPQAVSGRSIARQSAKSDLTRTEIKRAVAAVTGKAS